MREIKELVRSERLSRVMEVKLHSNTFRTPIYFPSISSYGLRFTLRNLFHFLNLIIIALFCLMSEQISMISPFGVEYVKPKPCGPRPPRRTIDKL